MRRDVAGATAPATKGLCAWAPMQISAYSTYATASGAFGDVSSGTARRQDSRDGGWGYLARIMPGSSVDAAHTATATPVWPRMIGCVHRRTPAASRPPLTKPHGALHIALHVAFSLLNVACCPLQLHVGRHRRQAKARVLSCPARRCPLHLTRTVPLSAPIPIGTEGYDDDKQPTADRRQHA